MKLRPFQEQLLRDTAEFYMDGHRAVLMQAAAGSGKTHVAAELIRRRLTLFPESRVIFAAPLDSIVDDTAKRLRAAGLHCGVFQASRAADPAAPVQVCSQQTLAARARDGECLPPADFVVVDEARHVQAPTMRAVLDRYPGALLLGLDATPVRSDGAALGDVFSAMSHGPSNAWLTANGYLVPCELVGPVVQQRGLACDPVEARARWCPQERTLVFCRSVAQAQRHAADFHRAGTRVALLTGDTPRAERERIREQFSAGTLRVLCTVGVVREGWDCPEASAAIFACPVGAVGAWLQMLGRISRTAPGKQRCIAVDLCGSWVSLGLRDDERVWSLTGEAVRPKDRLPPCARCRNCAAVFSPAPKCPRCGAAAEAIERVPRVLNRADKLALVSHLSEAERDRRYLASLERVAITNLRKLPEAAKRWALRKFEKQRGRKPACGAEVA